MIRRPSRSASLLLCTSLMFGLLAFSAIIGCGDSTPPGPERATASGKVEFDGKPVPAGSVSFIHKESGNMSSCMITNGVYTSEVNEGPVLGENTLSVSGYAVIDGKPLWGGVYSKMVTVAKDGFNEDFSITPAEVKPPDKNYSNPDDEMNVP